MHHDLCLYILFLMLLFLFSFNIAQSFKFIMHVHIWRHNWVLSVQHAFPYGFSSLTLHEAEMSVSGFFNRSILHLTLTSWPTLRQSDEKGKNPTATQGSRTGLCNASATLNTISSEPSPLARIGAWAPTVLFPDIPYFKFSILSCCGVSSEKVNTY